MKNVKPMPTWAIQIDLFPHGPTDPNRPAAHILKWKPKTETNSWRGPNELVIAAKRRAMFLHMTLSDFTCSVLSDACEGQEDKPGLSRAA